MASAIKEQQLIEKKGRRGFSISPGQRRLVTNLLRRGDFTDTQVDELVKLGYPDQVFEGELAAWLNANSDQLREASERHEKVERAYLEAAAARIAP